MTRVDDDGYRNPFEELRDEFLPPPEERAKRDNVVPLRDDPFPPDHAYESEFSAGSQFVDPGDTGSTWPTPVDNFDASTMPKRQWVYGSDYIRGYVSVVASAGGIGKTSNAIVEALAIITGRPLLGVDVKERTSVWIINLEDPRIEIEMRLLAAMKHYNIHPDEVRGKLFVDGEDTMQLTLASEGRDGVSTNDPLLNHMADKIKAHGIGVCIVDPFVSTHTVNENSNSSVQTVFAMFRTLARRTSSSVCLVHHVRKGNGDDATVDSVRGAGSIIGAARAVRVMNRISESDALSLGIPHSEARGIFRIDDGKANLAPPAEKALYRRMIGVKIDNDEWIGVTTQYDLPDEWSGMSEQVVNDMLRTIERGIPTEDNSEEYYSARSQDKARWVGRVIMDWPFQKAEDFKSEIQAKQIIKSWLASGLLEEIEYFSATQRKKRKGITATGRVGVQN